MASWGICYAAQGWRVFPAKRKVPALRGWQRLATTDPALIRAWWPRDDGDNMAVVAGEAFDCFDVEAEHVPALVNAMKAGRLSLPLTPIADTGRGGRHVLVKPTGVGGTRRLFLDGVHIGELKSRGGLVLVCPSTTAHPYTWRRAPADMAVAEAPGWLLALVEQRVPPAERMPWPTVSLAPASDVVPLAAHVRRSAPGNRNAALHWAACRAVESGVPEAIATEALLEAFLAAEAAGESRETREREGERTIQSAYAS